MRFWDSSAIASLLLQEKESAQRQSELEQDPVLVVWWGTAVELESVLTRRRCEGTLDEVNEA
ncbi:MAG: PIN domain-containing protein, partial [Methylophilaceae bacterium]|nr:PIN domain-containing protein [Methylophilaceae bacterium]